MPRLDFKKDKPISDLTGSLETPVKTISPGPEAEPAREPQPETPEKTPESSGLDFMRGLFPDEAVEEKTEEEAPTPSAEPISFADETGTGDYGSTDWEETGFKSTFPNKKLYFIFGGGVLLIVVLIFLLISFFSRGKETETAVSKPPEKTAPGEQPTGTSSVLQKMLPVYQENMAINRFIEQQLEVFLAGRPQSAEYSLIVISAHEINLTVLAQSRDKVAQFHLDLKKAFPNFGFQIISVQPKFEGNRQVLYADISARIKPPKAAGVGTLQPGTFALQVDNIEGALRQLAGSNRVKLQYFKRGKSFDKPNFREIYCYANLQGQKDNMINFLKAMISKYPGFRINKISIFPYNLAPISDRSLSTRINFTYYNPK